MLLGFKPFLKEPILTGTKIHTIRKDKHDRWHAGNSIQMATGVRTKQYEKFKDASCVSTQRIFMTYDHMLHISITDASGSFALAELYMPEKIILARNDGFDRYDDFEEWFYKEIKASEEHRFSGKIIHWTNFKY